MLCTMLRDNLSLRKNGNAARSGVAGVAGVASDVLSVSWCGRWCACTWKALGTEDALAVWQFNLTAQDHAHGHGDVGLSRQTAPAAYLLHDRKAPQISYATHPTFAVAVADGLASKTEWSGWGSSTCAWWLVVVCLAVDACKDVTVVKEGSSVRQHSCSSKCKFPKINGHSIPNSYKCHIDTIQI